MRKINSYIMAPVVLGTFLLGIGFSMVFNLWHTKSQRNPVLISEGAFEGVPDPSDIRGSYTLADITRNFDISTDILFQAFALPEDTVPEDFRIGSFEEIYLPMQDGSEIGTDSMRLFVAQYLGIPYEPEETTRLLSPVLSILREKLATADFELIRTIVVSPADLQTLDDLDPEEASALITEHEEMETEAYVKGNTSFYDLLDWGLTQEEIEAILERDMGASGILVRDFCTEYGLEFGTLKIEFQNLLDAMDSE